MRTRSHEGYALLAALVVVSLAAVFATTCVAAVSARQRIAASDATSIRCQAALRQALNEVCLLEERRPAFGLGTVTPADGVAADASWRADVSAPAVLPGGRWPTVVAHLAAVAGQACARATATIELRAVSFAQGVTIDGDVDLRAPTEVDGSGLYCAGCLRGRQRLVFGSGAAETPVPAPDWVRGETWPAAGVHAAGSIWADGAEIDASGSLPERFPADSDVHTGGAPMDMSNGPDSAFVAALREEAVAPAGALSDGILDVSLLPAAMPYAGGGQGQSYVVVVDALPNGVPVRVVGERPAGSCPVVLVLAGDAVLGDPGRGVDMRGYRGLWRARC